MRSCHAARFGGPQVSISGPNPLSSGCEKLRVGARLPVPLARQRLAPGKAEGAAGRYAHARPDGDIRRLVPPARGVRPQAETPRHRVVALFRRFQRQRLLLAPEPRGYCCTALRQRQPDRLLQRQCETLRPARLRHRRRRKTGQRNARRPENCRQHLHRDAGSPERPLEAFTGSRGPDRRPGAAVPAASRRQSQDPSRPLT